MSKRFQAIREKLILDKSEPKTDTERVSDIEFLLQVISIYHGAMLSCEAEQVIQALRKVKEMDQWEDVV